jgi:hypothetical protein
MNGLDVIGAICIVPAIYAISRYHRSSKLFVQMLSILAFGFIIGIGVRQTKRLLNKSHVLKEVQYVGKQAMGYPLSVDMGIVEYASAGPSFPVSSHAYAECSIPDVYDRAKRSVSFIACGYYNTS